MLNIRLNPTLKGLPTLVRLSGGRGKSRWLKQLSEVGFELVISQAQAMHLTLNVFYSTIWVIRVDAMLNIYEWEKMRAGINRREYIYKWIATDLNCRFAAKDQRDTTAPSCRLSRWPVHFWVYGSKIERKFYDSFIISKKNIII